MRKFVYCTELVKNGRLGWAVWLKVDRLRTCVRPLVRFTPAAAGALKASQKQAHRGPQPRKGYKIPQGPSNPLKINVRALKRQARPQGVERHAARGTGAGRVSD